MLEANGFETVALASPFFDASADRLCSEKNISPVTNRFVTYSYITMSVNQRKDSFGWSNDDLDKLSKPIAAFKRNGV